MERDILSYKRNLESYRRMIKDIRHYKELLKNPGDYKKMTEDMKEFEEMLELIKKYPGKTMAKRLPDYPWHEEEPVIKYIK